MLSYLLARLHLLNVVTQKPHTVLQVEVHKPELGREAMTVEAQGQPDLELSGPDTTFHLLPPRGRSALPGMSKFMPVSGGTVPPPSLPESSYAAETPLYGWQKHGFACTFGKCQTLFQTAAAYLLQVTEHPRETPNRPGHHVSIWGDHLPPQGLECPAVWNPAGR